MKTKLPLLLIFIALFSSLEEMNAQDFLKKIGKSNSAIKESKIYKKKNLPSKFELISLKENDFKTFLKVKSKNEKKTLRLPNTKGGFSNFAIKEVSNFETKLSEKFSNIKSYSAQGIDDPTAVAKISVGTDGFHAVVFSGKEETLYIDPYTKDNKTLIAYKRSDLETNKDDFTCQVEEISRKSITEGKTISNATDGKLRTFRLALVCSGEYAQFHLTNQNIESSATDEVKKAAVLSAMNTTMTRVNGVFERDLSVRMVIVGDNDKVIFLDAATDNITDGNPNTMINQVQSICDSEIGDANYDIGHVFSIGGDGLAGGGVVCITGSKARGVTGRSNPIGDAYDIDYVAHEMGHQFGANHTQNNDCNRNNITAVEPGSASTIMGYAGICSPNVQGQSDDYFHAVSIAEMWSVIQTSASCAVITDTSNSAPTANAGSDYSIPKSTPFVLKGTATDANGTSSLTYNWEQIDNEIASMSPLSANTGGPMFRSLSSMTLPNRYMPDLTTVLAGNTSSTWEVLPSVERDLNFSFLVRDNHAGGGSTARDDMKVSVENAEAFTVSAPNSAVFWSVGSTQSITWVKGTTDAAPINCLNVNIKLSIDGGVTFPIILKSNTPNDGVENIVIPNNITSSARVLVEAADNIFYNVNSTNFTIFKDLLLTSTTDVASACNTESQEASYILSVNFADDFSETVSLSSTGQPSGSMVTFSPTTLSGDSSITMKISNLNGITSQAYSINVEASSTSVTKSVNVQLNVTDSNFSALILTSPVNNELAVERAVVLKWGADVNASNYDVEVATDSGFSTIISSGNTTTNSYYFSNSSQNTTYYWKVKPKNTCGDGVFSEIFNFKTISSFYCASTFTDEVGGTEHITNVTFNTINNNSGNDTVDGYENFASVETNIKRGDSHQISVTLDTGGYQDHCFVFIDWNQDYVFDKATERYDLGTKVDADGDVNTTNKGTLTSDITVPDDAVFGSTIMRVVIEYDDSSSYGDGPCDSDHLSEYGETEDYTVIVDTTASIDDVVFEGFNLFPNPTKGEFTLNLKVINTDEVSVQLFDIRGRLIDEKKYYNTITNFSKRMSFEKASAGLYLLRVINGNKQTTRKLIIK
ncbi:reprolysin-like metallopeptidase [Polaribacter sp. SA4-12]|uniref:reprolysin-like metallopeptidase n=1 Tax=Polaribacter sp. SA4-12 TaxID=1312072 RepID=UPI000B3BEE3D|nr:zinc-dependent metalloprotease family protein [Polaribacter sp. SA4-12]ARV15322.1 hypothetical protein BTO07_09300 [Polaribacter sp. SA4-12]